MSIRDEIRARTKEGRLHLLPPLLASAPSERHMFVSPEVMKIVDSASWNEGGRTGRFARLRADLDDFTGGGHISIAVAPGKKPQSTYLARTAPASDDVWDIRSRDPKPGIRVLGCFAETDIFVVLAWAYRKDLGGQESKEWLDFILSCKVRWHNLFPTYPPHRGESINDYVSRKFHAV